MCGVDPSSCILFYIGNTRTEGQTDVPIKRSFSVAPVKTTTSLWSGRWGSAVLCRDNPLPPPPNRPTHSRCLEKINIPTLAPFNRRQMLWRELWRHENQWRGGEMVHVRVAKQLLSPFPLAWELAMWRMTHRVPWENPQIITCEQEIYGKKRGSEISIHCICRQRKLHSQQLHPNWRLWWTLYASCALIISNCSQNVVPKM